MNRDGAINAKAEIFRKAFDFREVASASLEESDGPLFAAPRGTEIFDRILTARRRRSLDASEQIALGLLRRPRVQADLKIGIFVQDERLRHSAIVEMALGIVGEREAEVIVTGPVRCQTPVNAGTCRPLRIGGSVGHAAVTAGTLGCFVRCRTSGDVGILSNNHVLAATNAGARGDVILQPGRADGGCGSLPTTHVAELRDFVPIDFAPDAANLVDCAFAPLTNGVGRTTDRVSDPLCLRADWSVATVDDLILAGAPVRKVGRTTGYTEGSVLAIGVDNVVVRMPGRTRKIARFDQQFAIAGSAGAFSSGGDSGSLIFTQEGHPAALLFAGTESGGPQGGGITYANPIQTVLDLLNLDIYTGQ
ncbi:hypothetical protein J2X36_004188 [Methylobacterium sp. BE186]|nr:hypothetical protein [Methylobacterium sp. BE186]